jgi:hypothetical protein
VLELLYKKIKNASYYHLRNIFLNIIAQDIRINDINDARLKISNLLNMNKEPSNSDIEDVTDPSLRDLLLKLKNSNINKLRNEVVHKYAYLPSQNEVELALEDTRCILFGLATKLGICGDDIYSYLIKK